MGIASKLKEIKIVTIIKIIVYSAALLPMLIVIITAEDSLMENAGFNKAIVFGILGALIFGAIFANLVTRFLFDKTIQRMKKFCIDVKRGVYNGFDDLPNQGGDNADENEFLSLMRDMNWMAHIIQV